jgi:hypothetical protein
MRRPSGDRSNRSLRTHRFNPTWTNLVRRLKYVQNVWREVGNAIGAGTHYHDPERKYFYVLLELNIAVESYKYVAYVVRAA